MKYKGIKKLYYSISEISEMLDIKQSVIRYWESEFKELKPQKNRAGNRIYKKDDIAILRMIDYYVHGKHLSIHEANDVISDLKAEGLYKRKLQELNELASATAPVDKKAVKTIEPEAEAELDDEENELIIEKDESIIESEEEISPISETPPEEVPEPESKFEIVKPTEETFIYPLDEIRDEEEPEEDLIKDESGEPEIEISETLNDKDLLVEEEQTIEISTQETEVNEEIELEPEPEHKEEAKSDPELRELLKKISKNIRDIIDILNE